MDKNILIIVVGTTAIGKTAKAIELAQFFDCEIISCDSRQFFKEMTIGTAVPSEDELKAVPHHFIQNKSIFESYNVGDFEREALEKLDVLFLKNRIQVMVGGSGLYVDAIVKGFDDFPEIEMSIREEIKKEYEQKGITFLQKKLEEVDSEYYNRLREQNPQTLENPQRMMRFVEVSIGSGKPYSSFLNQGKNQRNFTPVFIGLEAPREIMYDRINQRVDVMLKKGLLKEAADLKNHQHLNALQTVGYRELFNYFDGQISLDQATEEIKKNTRRFAKRQLTWFKRNETTKWFSYNEPLKNIIAYISATIYE